MALNVLVVDDSPVMRKMVRRSLGMCGLPMGEIHEAGDGKEALGVLSDRWVDVVVADINMPVMNGIEMVEKMAEDRMISRIPVVMVTSDRSEAHVDRLRKLGVRAYLTKPFRPEAFREVVEELLPIHTALKAEPTPALLAELGATMLEECVFVVARAADDPPPLPADAIRADISFDGPVPGRLSIAAGAEMGRELAAAMLGVEPGDADAERAVGSALGELANILCGVLVERLFGAQITCRLGLPVMARGPEPDPRAVSVTLVDDERRAIAFALSLDHARAAAPKRVQ